MVAHPPPTVTTVLDEYQRSWLLAGAGFFVYAGVSVAVGWWIEPGSITGFLWMLGMVCFGCGAAAAFDRVARVREAAPRRP